MYYKSEVLGCFLGVIRVLCPWVWSHHTILSHRPGKQDLSSHYKLRHQNIIMPLRNLDKNGWVKLFFLF